MVSAYIKQVIGPLSNLESNVQNSKQACNYPLNNVYSTKSTIVTCIDSIQL